MAVGASTIVKLTFPVQSARFVRLTLKGTASNWWSIHELNVSLAGGATSLPPLSRAGWTASASLTCQQDVAANAIDGDKSTRWSTGVTQATGQWFQLDMGSPQIVTQLVIDAGASVGDYPRSFKITASDDGTHWSASLASGTGAGPLITVAFPARLTRFLRVTLTGSGPNWWSIHEINVYGTASLEDCVAAVPANQTLSGAARELQYQQDILQYCTGTENSTCLNTVRARARVDYFTAAASMYTDRISTGQYGLFVRDREALLLSIDKDAALACNVAAHDADGDFVPDNLDACPMTPPLTPVLPNGCSHTPIPTGPDVAEVKDFIKYFGISVDPRCKTATRPAVPAPLGVFRGSDRSLGKAVWLSRDPGTSLCPLYFEIEFYLTDSTGRAIPGLRTITLPSGAATSLSWITPPVGASQFHITTADAGDGAAWAVYSVFTYSLRARAFNLAGQRSAWSDFFTLSTADCVAGQPCTDR
jgi:hypothetical protein